MKVEDALACVRADVVHRPIAILDTALAAEPGRDEVAVPNDLGFLRLGFF
jgi:hypothetical protein